MWDELPETKEYMLNKMDSWTCECVAQYGSSGLTFDEFSTVFFGT